MEHLLWAGEITEAQLRNDLFSGKLTRELYNILKEPYRLLKWTIEEFEDKL